MAKPFLFLFLLGNLSAPAFTQTPGAQSLTTKILMQEPLDDTSEPKMSLFILDLSAGQSFPTHMDAEAIFVYVLQGEIENQVDPDPPVVYRAGGFFHVRAMQVHRVLRNLSATEPAKLLVFQNTGAFPPNAKPLIQGPLSDIAQQEVSVMTLVAGPGEGAAAAHQHLGPVFAYVLKGEIESQVDPEPPKTYRAGDVFYEPPRHIHRLFRNLSKTEPAELLIFQVGEKGQPRATGVEQ
jgi:quercetin dioxygenase-like cupin family protein